MVRIDRVAATLLGVLLLLNLSDLNPLLLIREYQIAYNQVAVAAIAAWGNWVLLAYPIAAALLIYGATGSRYLTRSS